MDGHLCPTYVLIKQSKQDSVINQLVITSGNEEMRHGDLGAVLGFFSPLDASLDSLVSKRM